MIFDPIFDTKDYINFLKAKLKRTFDKFPENRTLYIDQQILNLMNFIYDHKLDEFTKQQKINKSTYDFNFGDQQGLDISKNSTIIFFLYPKVEYMKKIKQIIEHNQFENKKKQYFLLLTPKKTFLCIDQLQKYEVLNKIHIESFNFDLIPLNNDLLSLQLKNTYFDLIVNKNQNILKLITQSILKIENIYGTFKYVFAKGELSTQIIDLVNTKFADQKFEKKQSQHQIHFFIFDRTCDLVTPMLTPFTYQALLDMKYNINLNKIYVKGQLIGQKSQKSAYLLYNQLDQTYPEVSRKYIKQILPILQNKCKNLQTEIRKKQQISKGDVDQLSDLHKLSKTKLSQYLAAKNHLSISLDLIKQFQNICTNNRLKIQSNMIIQKELNLQTLEHMSLFFNVQNLLRLVCLASNIYGGLKQKILKNIQQIIVRNYGLIHAFTFKNLKQAGLITNYVTKGNWSQIKNKFQLINQNTDYTNPNDYSYIFIIYASLITRMIQQGIKNPQAWNDNKQKYNLVKGPALILQHKQTQFIKKQKKKLYITYFVGGVTYAQIESIRFLSQTLKKQIIICTTNIVNGNSLIRQCFQQDLIQRQKNDKSEGVKQSKII